MIGEQKINVSSHRNIQIVANIAAALLSGAMLFIAFPSYDLPIFAWFGLVPLFLVLSRSKPLSGFILSFLFAVIFYSGVFFWMFDLPKYRILHHALLGIYLCPLLGIFGWLFSLMVTRFGVAFALFAAPFFWVTQEYIRSNLSFVSLPWGLLAHSQYQCPNVIQFASITGAYGVSFLIVLVNSAIAALIFSLLVKSDIYLQTVIFRFSKRGIKLMVGSTVVFFVIILTFGYILISKPATNEMLTISLIQGNIEQSKKWDKKYAATIMQIYADLTQKASKGKPVFIVWPETATPGSIQDPKLYSQVSKIAKSAGTHLLLGSAQLQKFKMENNKVKNFKYLNSAYLIPPDGGKNKNQRYDKIRLLPFGEYLPYKDTIPWSYIQIPETSKYLPGNKYKIFNLMEFRFGVTICWENIFPNIARQFVREGAQFIVNITNEAWFGESAAPYQFLSMSVFRAVENRIYMIRCANTGISCFIDPNGRIVNRLRDISGKDIFVRGVLTGSVSPLENKTIYTRFGDWFVWLCVISSILFLLVTFLRENPAKYFRNRL